MVKCNNCERKCGWVGELRSLDNHLTTCEYALLRCTNECIYNTVLRRDLDNHLKNKCPNRQYQCPHCNTAGRHCDITTTHLDTCPKVEVLCSNSECKAVVARCDLADHLAMCKYALLHCPNKCMVVVRILRRDLDNHLKNECPNRQYECPDCKTTGRYCDMTTAHLDTCPKVKIPCPNIHCKALVPRFKLSDHLTTCEYALLHCPNKCMENTKEVRMLRCDLDHHLKNKCPNRQYQCPHCKDTGRHCDKTTTHLDVCPKLEVPCPNSNCLVSVPRCDLSAHRSTCKFEKVPCKYIGIGCKKEPLRKDLQQHENDDTFHLHLAIETVNEQQKKMKVMDDKIVSGQVGPCVFKMPKFNQHKSSKRAWYSPPFYTHPGGYKMCVRVDADGFGEGAGTHVSVFASLMQGRNDDNLPWPFTGKVTFTLLNQQADENHHTDTASLLRDDEEYRVVVGERSRTGYGFPKFISHSQLDHGAAQNQYLKDGCLYFQVKVQAPKPTKPWLICTV